MSSNESLSENTDRGADEMFMGFRCVVSCEAQFTEGKKRCK